MAADARDQSISAAPSVIPLVVMCATNSRPSGGKWRIHRNHSVEAQRRHRFSSINVDDDLPFPAGQTAITTITSSWDAEASHGPPLISRPGIGREMEHYDLSPAAIASAIRLLEHRDAVSALGDMLETGISNAKRSEISGIWLRDSQSTSSAAVATCGLRRLAERESASGTFRAAKKTPRIQRLHAPVNLARVGPEALF
jgi:hypothetical protein